MYVSSNPRKSNALRLTALVALALVTGCTASTSRSASPRAAAPPAPPAVSSASQPLNFESLAELQSTDLALTGMPAPPPPDLGLVDSTAALPEMAPPATPETVAAAQAAPAGSTQEPVITQPPAETPTFVKVPEPPVPPQPPLEPGPVNPMGPATPPPAVPLPPPAQEALPPQPTPLEMPAPAIDSSASGAQKSLDEQYLKAVLDGGKEKLAQVQQRISYPDDLFGGAVVRSSKTPGQVTIYYPLRSIGGVSCNVTRDASKEYAIALVPPTQAQVDVLINALKRYLGEGETVLWYCNRNMLEITANEDNVPFIKDILEFLDTPQKQIIIEAAVWEVTDATDTQLGSKILYDNTHGGGDFFNMFNSRYDTQQFLNSLTSGQPFQGSTLDFVNAADSHGAKMNVVLQFLKIRGYADLVSQPRMRVAVGQTARIFTGQEIPFTETKVITNHLELYTKFRSVGVQLFVTPMVAGQDMITVSALTTVSDVTGQTEQGPSGVVNPIISTREAATQVTVANKELITVGGMDQTKKIVSEVKVPIIGDIPILGYLFKSKRDVSQKIQLWFTIQPTIANDNMRIVVPEMTGLPAGAK